MKERPIIMSGPMVRALIDGRKCQTRRIIKDDWWRCLDPEDDEDRARAVTMCRFGQVGHLLWVRETWRISGHGWDSRDDKNHLWVQYRADGEDGDEQFCRVAFEPTRKLCEQWERRQHEPWRPSIHMPRWASRITLELTDVRIEHVQDISEEDAKAEGLSTLTKDNGETWKWGIPDRDGLPGNDDDGWHWSDWSVDPRKAFAKLWDSIHGPGAWERNDWVFAISFRRLP